MGSDDGYVDVDELEEECEQAIRGVVDEYFEDLPPRTLHLMAKAAVAVLEAVVDQDDEEDEEEDDEGFEDEDFTPVE